MRKIAQIILLLLSTVLLIVLVAIPFAVPLVVETILTEKINAFGLATQVRMSLGYRWRNGPGLTGRLLVALTDSPWRVTADFGASCGEWSVSLRLPPTKFDETDTALQTLLKKYPVPALSNLTFSGRISLDAQAARTFRKPVPVWSVRAPLRDFSAACAIGDKPYAIDGFSLTAGADGIADHLDILPTTLRATSLSACGFSLTNFSAAVRMTEKALLITQASAEFGKGKINLYSLFLDHKNLNTGLTLFLDDIEASDVLTRINGFHGEASGRLHGKVKLFLREGGKSIRLSDAFLYSTPGETGKLKINDPTPVTDNLALAGLDTATQDNVANALSDLDYSVLRLNLKRTDGKTATLSTTIRGVATRGDLSVPVDITLNFNGNLEQLVNTGLNYSNLLKEKGK